jgi:hypothetical protein
MSANEYFKIKTSGALVHDIGLNPQLEKKLKELGLNTVGQLYGALKASPEAFVALLREFGIEYQELLDQVFAELSPEDHSRQDANPTPSDYSMGHLGSPPPGGPDIIRREPRSK